jgi:hypothetical protein
MLGEQKWCWRSSGFYFAQRYQRSCQLGLYVNPEMLLHTLNPDSRTIRHTSFWCIQFMGIAAGNLNKWRCAAFVTADGKSLNAVPPRVHLGLEGY